MSLDLRGTAAPLPSRTSGTLATVFAARDARRGGVLPKYRASNSHLLVTQPEPRRRRLHVPGLDCDQPVLPLRQREPAPTVLCSRASLIVKQFRPVVLSSRTRTRAAVRPRRPPASAPPAERLADSLPLPLPPVASPPPRRSRSASPTSALVTPSTCTEQRECGGCLFLVVAGIGGSATASGVRVDRC